MAEQALLQDGKTYGVLSEEALGILSAGKNKEILINPEWRKQLSSSTPWNGLTILNPEKDESRKKLGMSIEDVIIFFRTPEINCYPYLLRKIFVNRVLMKESRKQEVFLSSIGYEEGAE